MKPSTPHHPHTLEMSNGVNTRLVGADLNSRLDEWRGEHPHYGCSSERASKGAMVMFVIALAVLTYVPYVILNENRSSAGVACVVVFHVPFVLMLCSYMQVVLIDPGTVPVWWHDAVAAKAQRDYPVCKKCNLHKPPRSHFDSETERLVLNMDHYCPWVANTVGFYNRKFFVLFVMYTFIGCTWVCITMLSVFQDQLLPFFGKTSSGPPTTSTPAPRSDDDDIPQYTRILFGLAFVINALFSLILSCFTYYHVKMALFNETTIEGTSLPQYNISLRENWEQVFGSNPFFWFLPFWGPGPNGDGIRWKMTDGRIDGLLDSRLDQGCGTEMV
eukprot:TRINITY_DN21058_c0_g1_i1.p1 TRINITY_DN21058_c0_g1~~TRINITY_DN21058_c0_g1_i1.p1  ORF type:complete len:330 (+),score=32.35 TRINITY_DN21058_c0_g1_i1:46-1035(+)